MIYKGLPKVIGIYPIICREVLAYQYMPIKLIGETKISVEPRLMIFDKIIGVACCDFIGTRGLNEFVASYVYITAKRRFQKPGQGITRPGWHCDGFKTTDINYLWSDNTPTVFNNSEFDLCDDENLSMVQMTAQADPIHNFYYPNDALLRVDEKVVHKPDDVSEDGMRTFVKISFSRDKYDLAGNTINYMLDYDWQYRPREFRRNVPQSLG